MKVKLEETPGARDTAKNIVRNDKRNEKKPSTVKRKRVQRNRENSKGDV